MERELKLEVPDGFSLARLPRELDGYVASPAQFRRLHTVYYDTRDLRLTRWGCSLRYRRDEGWTLKLPVPDASKTLIREEHVFEGSDAEIPAAALDLATAYIRGAEVVRIAELRTLRSSRELHDGTGEDLAEVVEDDVRVVDGTHVTRHFHQIEIELADSADASAIDSISRVLRSEGAGPPNPIPKNVLAIGDGAAEPELLVPEIGPDSTAGDVVRAAFAKSVELFIRSDAKLRLSDDAEIVHHARVAIRRLRSDLRSFGPLLEEQWACALRDKLSWLQDALSAVRDNDVLASRLKELAGQLSPSDFARAAPILDSLRKSRDEAHEQARKTLHDEAYVQLLNEIVEAARQPRLVEMAAQPASAVLSSLINYPYKRTRKAVRRAGQSPSDRDLHKIRIRAKYLRYAAEAFSPVAGRAAQDVACKAEELQTILGDQHDGVVAVARLRGFTAPVKSLFAAGELAMLAQQFSLAAQSRWRKAWRRLRRARNDFRARFP